MGKGSGSPAYITPFHVHKENGVGSGVGAGVNIGFCKNSFYKIKMKIDMRSICEGVRKMKILG